MSIATLAKKGKYLLAKVPYHAYIVAVLILASTLSFMLGIALGKDLERQATDLQIASFEMVEKESAKDTTEASGASEEALPQEGGGYVASKNGTRYYLPWCGGASRIKEENKVWFQTKEEAEARGLTPAKNCPGL